MATEKFSPWITVLVSAALTFFSLLHPVPVRNLSDLSYPAIPSNMIFIVVFNHLKAIVFKFFCVTYLQIFPLEKTKQTKEAQPNIYRHIHTYSTHTYICQKSKQKISKFQFSFPLQSYMKSEGQVIAMCGSVPKAVQMNFSVSLATTPY